MSAESVVARPAPPVWGTIVGTLGDQTDVADEFGTKADNSAVDGTTYVMRDGGWVVDERTWVWSTTTDASGNWTVDMTSAGFASPPIVVAVVESADTAAVDIAWTNVHAPTATSASGSVATGRTLVALGATAQKVGAGVKVNVFARAV